MIGIKKGVRIIAIDDFPIEKKFVPIIGVVYRENILEGVISSRVKKDGKDSTIKIIKMIKNSKFKNQIRIVVIHSLMLAGFNIVDLEKIEKELNVIAISVTKTKPSKRKVEVALKKLGLKRIKLIKKVEVVKYKNFFIQGINVKQKLKQLKDIDFLTPLRIAHKIASGLGKGESDGRL
ncbi:MAG: DUF99 family protein [Candidatus Micrarchaeales archaeon]